MDLRLHAFLPASRANGPGLRAVVWTQGCTLACPGCFNPATHSAAGGEPVPVEDLAARLLSLPGIEGLTISGGEPLQQPEAVYELLTQVRRASAFSVLLFSGFSLAEIERMPAARRVLPLVDVLIAGRFRTDLPTAQPLLGSSNQQVHLLTTRYTLPDLQTVPPAEVVISEDGEVFLSGIDPLR